jgi:hypothetical protein
MSRADPTRRVIDAAPLFVAQEIARLDRLKAERDGLRHRIARLPARAERRIVLQARLVAVVADILRLEALLFRRAA